MILAPRYDKAEFARRGEEIYVQRVSPQVAPEDEGKFVAIDIESGDFAVDPDDFEATEQLLKRRPNAQIWLHRVGHRTAYRIARH